MIFWWPGRDPRVRARLAREYKAELMADNLKKRGKADRSLVNSRQLHEIRYWSKRFACSQRELVLAEMAAPTCTPEDVGEQLVKAEERLRSARKLARKEKR